MFSNWSFKYRSCSTFLFFCLLLNKNIYYKIPRIHILFIEDSLKPRFKYQFLSIIIFSNMKDILFLLPCVMTALIPFKRVSNVRFEVYELSFDRTNTGPWNIRLGQAALIQTRFNLVFRNFMSPWNAMQWMNWLHCGQLMSKDLVLIIPLIYTTIHIHHSRIHRICFYLFVLFKL